MVADGESDELQDTFVSCDGSPNEQVTFRIGWNVTVAYAVFSGMVQEYGACYGRRILAAYDFYAFSGMRDDKVGMLHHETCHEFFCSFMSCAMWAFVVEEVYDFPFFAFNP